MMKKLQFKRILSLSAALLFLLMGGGIDLMGQTVIEFATGTSTTSNSPVKADSKYSTYECIYTATELNTKLTAAGCPAVGNTITAIAYKSKTAVSRSIEIYITTTTLSNVSNSADVVSVNRVDKVFDGSVDFIANEWTPITLNTQYEWDGTSNILILVNDKTGTKGSSVLFYYTSTSGYTTIYNNDDTYAFDPSGMVTNGTRSSNRNQIQFTIETTNKPRPKQLAVSTYGTTTATLGWAATSDAATSYTYQYKLSTGNWSTPSDIIGEETINALTKDLSGLEAGEIYSFRVKANYSEGSSRWIEKEFMTIVDVTGVNKYSYGFEDNTEYEFWTKTLALKGCGITSDDPNTNYNCFRNAATSNNSNTIISPKLNASTNGVHVEFYWKGPNTTNTMQLIISYSTTDINTFTQHEIITTNKNSYTKYESDISYPVKYIAIKYQRNGWSSSNSGNVYIDDIELSEVFSCVAPVDLNATSVTRTSATLNWTSGASTFDLQYKKSGAADFTTVSNITKPYVLTVDEASEYIYKVRAHCGGEEVSDYSDEFTFHSEFCDSEDQCVINYSLNDKSSDGWTGAHLTIIDHTTSIAIADLTLLSTDSKPKIGTVTVCPGRDYDIIWHKGSFDNECSFIISDINDEEIINVAQNKASSFSDGETILPEYTATCIVNDCEKPQNFAISGSPTSDEVTLIWDEILGVEGYEVYISESSTKPSDAESGEFTASNSFTKSSLKHTTQYYAWVRTKCDEEDSYSFWSDRVAFVTDCAAFDIPYSYGFESDMDMVCWSMENCDTQTGIANTDGHNGSSNTFRFYHSTTPPQYLISPELGNVSSWGVRVTLYYKTTTFNEETFQVGYSTTYNTTSSFDGNWDVEIAYQSAEWEKYTHVFPSDTKYIAIRYNSDNKSFLYIDDISFTEPENEFTTVGAWNVASNWSHVTVPTSSDDVIINAACTIPNTYTAQVNNIKIGPSGSLTIENGGELILSNSNTDVEATVKKTVAASTEKETTNNWYAISSPTHDDGQYYESFSNVSNLTPAAPDYLYNVYRYDEYSVVWQEHRDENNLFTTMKKGRGYLFRTTKGGDLEYSGVVNTDTVKYNLSWSCPTTKFKGFNLIGNPYTHTIYKGAEGSAIPNGSILEDKYYTIGTNGRLTLTADGTAIAPGQAIFVQAKSASTLTMANSTSGKVTSKYANDNIWFMVKNAESSDLACVEFRKGHGLNKVEHRNDITPMLYIMHNGENFASADMSDNTSVINLGFEAKTTGEYTFSLKARGTYSYMHLIDKITGANVDMLIEDSYSFVGSPRDRKDRFELRLNYNAANIDSESDIFAYQNGADIIVRGEGELQVFDVTGRMAMRHQINGVQTVNGLNNGVYIFRLVGTEVKTQKIVVR